MLIEDVISADFELRRAGHYFRSIDHDSLVVDPRKQLFYWNSIGISGNLFTWFTRIKGMKPQDAIDLLKQNSLFIDNYSSEVITDNDDIVIDSGLVTEFYNLGKSNREYWHLTRGYNDSTIDMFKLGFTGEYYTIPIFVDGVFYNFQCRKHKPKRIRMWYSLGYVLPFNFSVLNNSNDYVVVTEGLVDAIMLQQNGIPAISQSGGAGNTKIFTDSFSKFNNVDTIYICYDNDDAGDSGAKRVASLFGYKAKVYNMWDFESKFDITDYFVNNTGGVSDFMELLTTKSKFWFEL